MDFTRAMCQKQVINTKIEFSLLRLKTGKISYIHTFIRCYSAIIIKIIRNLL